MSNVDEVGFKEVCKVSNLDFKGINRVNDVDLKDQAKWTMWI